MKTRLLRYVGVITSVLTYCCVQAAPVNTVVATVNVGVTPAGLAITPDSRYAYVANNNNYAITNSDTVSVIDLATNLVVDTIVTGTFNEQAYTVTINSAGTRAYVTNSNWSTVVVIDTATNSVIATIDGFDGPSGFVIVPGDRAYVNNYGGPTGVGSGNANTVRVVDLNTNSIIGAPIVVDLAPAAMAVTPDGAFVYVINYVDGNPGTGTIRIIRTSDNAVVGSIPGFSGPFAIAITPDGQFAYVTNFGSNNFIPIGSTVSVVNLTTNTVVATIDLGIQPSGIGITPDGRYAYATNYNALYADSVNFTSLTPGEGTVNIIDIATNTVLPPTIVVGQAPDAVAIAPNGAFAYVTNYISNTVSVIALPTFQIVAQGTQIKNIFLTQEDIVNKLTWTVSGGMLPVQYAVYRNAELTDLAGFVGADQPLEFYDHARVPGVAYTYYIVGTNAVGTTSAPVVVTVG